MASTNINIDTATELLSQSELSVDVQSKILRQPSSEQSPIGSKSEIELQESMKVCGPSPIDKGSEPKAKLARGPFSKRLLIDPGDSETYYLVIKAGSRDKKPQNCVEQMETVVVRVEPQDLASNNEGLNKGSSTPPTSSEQPARKKRKRPPKIHVCKTCGKAFSVPSQLERHGSTHTEKRLFKCKVCDKSYKDKYFIKIHMRTHTGERPFQCEYCGRSFTMNKYLTMHRMTHTQELPYACDSCGHAFKSRWQLNSHIKRWHGPKDFNCELCDQAFCTKGELLKHETSHGSLG